MDYGTHSTPRVQTEVVDNPCAHVELSYRQPYKTDMAANPRQTVTKDEHGVATRMCSIKPTGLVFESMERFDISSEIGLIIETNVLGLVREWTVMGWGVDCAEVVTGNTKSYQVTLFFTELPKGMTQMLSLSGQVVAALLPRTPESDLFGLN